MYLYPSQCESIRKMVLISFVEKRLKIKPTQSETSNWMNPNESEVNFQSEWIRIKPDTNLFLIRMNQCAD